MDIILFSIVAILLIIFSLYRERKENLRREAEKKMEEEAYWKEWDDFHQKAISKRIEILKEKEWRFNQLPIGEWMKLGDYFTFGHPEEGVWIKVTPGVSMSDRVDVKMASSSYSFCGGRRFRRYFWEHYDLTPADSKYYQQRYISEWKDSLTLGRTTTFPRYK